MERCEQCGFVYDLEQAEAVGPAVIAEVDQLAAILTATVDDAGLRARPEPGRWSALEYACHVRDVLLVQRERVFQARRVERPELVPMGREDRVEHDGYAEQDPGDVARHAAVAAELFANVLDRLGDGDWQRTVVYGYPDRQERSLRWVAVHTWHEVGHHLGDVRDCLAGAA